MKQKPGLVRTWPQAIAYGSAMFSLSVISTVIVAFVLGGTVALFVRVFMLAYHLFR